MFTCKRCELQSRDGVKCSSCEAQFDFPCAGITEGGWRKLGDRKLTWRCQSCKAAPAASPKAGFLNPSPDNSDTIMAELKRLSTQLEALPKLIESVKSVQAELADLKTMRDEFWELKSSFDAFGQEIKALTSKVSALDAEIESMKKAKEEISNLQYRITKLENKQAENEQRSRMNNIEIKGVPITKDEDLYVLMSKISDTIGLHIPKSQINYIARVPTRNDNINKNIICSVHNNYLKNDFIAAAKKHKNLKAEDLGLHGNNRIYINDHLTLDNKLLLNKTKTQAKERGFEHVWVTGCKILVRKNTTSPKHHIKTEKDLKKFLC